MYVDKDFVIGTFLGKSSEIMLHGKTRRMFSGKISHLRSVTYNDCMLSSCHVRVSE